MRVVLIWEENEGRVIFSACDGAVGGTIIAGWNYTERVKGLL